VIRGLARRVERSVFVVREEEEVFIVRSSKPGHVALLHHEREVFRYESGNAVNLGRRHDLFDLIHEKESVIRSALQNICASLLQSSPRISPFELDCYSIVSHVVVGLVKRMDEGAHGGLIVLLPPSQGTQAAAESGKYTLLPTDRRVLPAKIAELANSKAERWNLPFEGRGVPTTSDDAFERALVEDNEMKARAHREHRSALNCRQRAPARAGS
jgi:hypothetical protein